MFKKTLAFGAAALLSIGLLACGGESGDNANSGGSAAAPTVLRFSGIPDADKEMLAKKFKIVEEYLKTELKMDVEFVPANDYNGAVESLVKNKVDLAWLGGVTSVLAEERSEGKAHFIACRESDKQFKSYFIAHSSAGLSKLNSLADLKGKNLKFSFGDKTSTSGHIMPRYYLAQAGVDPEKDFNGAAGFQAQGGHSATLGAVNSGQAQVGALNFKTFDKADADKKSNSTVVFETPPYVDYCMVAHDRLGAEMIGKIKAAFLKLDPANPEHKKVLEAFDAGSERFVAADPKEWDGIRGALKDARAKGILD